MRVTVLARRPSRHRAHPLLAELTTGLQEKGACVRLVDPDADVHDLADLRDEADLYVLKSGTEAALSMAGALDAVGARLVNPYRVAADCRDKIVQTRRLASTCVPVPRSWLTTQPTTLSGELDHGPLIFKDPRGSRGRGLHLARRRADLAAIQPGRPWLVMRYHRPDGPDLKLYRIGGEVFGVERVFPATTHEEKVGHAFTVPADLRRIVQACGEAFGISLYGVDVIRSAGRAWVVDMSSFPGFKGVPDAGHRIAAHLMETAAMPADESPVRAAT